MLILFFKREGESGNRVASFSLQQTVGTTAVWGYGPVEYTGTMSIRDFVNTHNRLLTRSPLFRTHYNFLAEALSVSHNIV